MQERLQQIFQLHFYIYGTPFITQRVRNIRWSFVNQYSSTWIQYGNGSRSIIESLQNGATETKKIMMNSMALASMLCVC